MKISISYWGLEGGLEAKKDVVAAMREAKALGFDAIEPAVASAGALTFDATREQCAALRRAAREIGIEIASVASGESWTSSPTANDAAARERILAWTKKGLQIASWLGADAYLFVPGAVDVFFLPGGEVVPYDVCHQRAVEGIRRLLPIAEETGVAICIENVWNKFLLSPMEMAGFIDSFRSPFVKAYVDVGNMLLYGYPDQWLRILGPRVKRVHVKDFDRAAGTAAGFCDLLAGSVDFAAVKRALAEIGYDGYLTAEILPFQPGRPQKTAAAMKKLFR
mgnify:CR=1 FL=1